MIWVKGKELDFNWQILIFGLMEMYKILKELGEDLEGFDFI